MLLSIVKLEHIRVQNFLGFGDPGVDLRTLGPREVCVGPNAVGKSSLLHAIEFVGRVFREEVADGQRYVNKGDPLKSLQVEVGVQLEPEEIRALGTVLTYSTTIQQSPWNNEWKADTTNLNRMVRQALSKEPRLFDSLFTGVLRFHVVSAAGLGQKLRAFVEIPDVGGSVYTNRFGTISSSEDELSGWTNFVFVQEILNEVETSVPGVLTSPAPDFNKISEAVAKAVSTKNRAWLISRLRPREGRHTALYFDHLSSFTDQQQVPSGAPDLVQLRTMLLERGFREGYATPQAVLGTIFNTSLLRLSDTRSRPEHVAIQDSSSQLGYSPILTGSELAQLLFFLKNSWSDEERARYASIQEAFHRLTGFRFDVILNPEAEQPETTSAKSTLQRDISTGGESGTAGPPRFKHYPYIVFEEEGYSFLVDFGAAGFFEVLLVLAATMGPTHSVVLLDEPVMNLHPSKQRELYEFLKSDARDRSNQLFIVTHSTNFVSVEDLAKALRFTRGTTGPVVRRLQYEGTWEEAQAHKDLDRTPRLLDALFARKVILVEGGGEAAALPLWFAKCAGGSSIAQKGVLFVDAGSDTHFGALIRILEAWGIPYRIVADAKATERVKQFGEKALVYPFEDFSVLLRSANLEDLKKTVAEVGGSGGDKDPAVARVMANRLAPPDSVRALWEGLQSFIEES